MADLPHNAASLEYTSLPMSGSFIRLLDIYPGDLESVLKCELRVASLRSQLSYKTVSYAWINDPNDSYSGRTSIICGLKNVMIPKNLHSALQTFRSSASTVTLWVDFLCINQQDTEERTQQVGMMRSIYSNCSEVLIWLGSSLADDYPSHEICLRVEGDTSVKVAWHHDARDEDMIHAYVEHFNNCEDLGNDKFPIHWSQDIFGALCVLRQLAQGVQLKRLRFYKATLTSPEQVVWAYKVRQGMAAILDSSWWQRTWVVQETILPRKATVHFGHFSAPWIMLSEGAAAFLRELATLDVQDTLSVERDPLLVLSRAIMDFELVRIARIDEVRLPLLSMLRCFRTKKSSDSRDKVFALLGLARESIQDSLRPDYRMNRDEVMLSTTIAAIRESGGLEPLAGRVAGPNGRRSWVTNWDDWPEGNERDRLDCQHLYRACADNPGVAYLHDENLLEVEGYFVGEIRYVGEEAPDGGFDRLRGFVNRWERDWRVLRANNFSGSWGDKYDSFWRTITADTLYAGLRLHASWSSKDTSYRRATSDGSSDFAAWKADDTGQRHRKSSMGPGDLLNRYIEPEELTVQKNRFRFAVQTASVSRRFFVTMDGLMGLGPANLQINDELYVVHGSRVPLATRSRSQTYRCSRAPLRNLYAGSGRLMSKEKECNKLHKATHVLVGDAYVHGVMDGEVVNRNKKAQPLYLL